MLKIHPYTGKYNGKTIFCIVIQHIEFRLGYGNQAKCDSETLYFNSKRKQVKAYKKLKKINEKFNKELKRYNS